MSLINLFRSKPHKTYFLTIVKFHRYHLAAFTKEGDTVVCTIQTEHGTTSYSRKDKSIQNALYYLEYTQNLTFHERREINARFPKTRTMNLHGIVEYLNTLDKDPYPTFSKEELIDCEDIINSYTKLYSRPIPQTLTN